VTIRPLTLVILAAASLASLACGDDAPKKGAPKAGAAAGTGPAAGTAAALPAGSSDGGAASPDGGATDTKGGEYAYSSVGKRDPFHSFLSELSRENRSGPTRCNTPLGRFELEQLKLVGVVTGLSDPMAMVEAPDGVGYSVRRGVCIGKNGGTVTAVRAGEVVVTEYVIKADGSKEKTQTLLKLPKEAAPNLEER
jgi:type IV pilus assembly protein PilP